MSSQSAAVPSRELHGHHQLLIRTVFGAAIFTSACLLFQVQLLLAKFLLPWFGGAAAVWTTCMLYFQILLLAGYAYAHFLSTRFRLRWQFRLHLSLLAASLIMLGVRAFIWNSPITPGPDWKPLNGDAPITGLLSLLSVTIGLPFLLLSATSPLLQKWLAAGPGSVREGKSGSVYKLYALSNLGSMLGLLSYPFLVEPHLSLLHQARIWSVAYLCFAILCALCIKLRNCVWTDSDLPHRNVAPHQPTTITSGTRTLWFSLAACASVMLLATTNLICQDLGVVPLLWVLPLALYLLSFILCFGSRRIYRRELFHPSFAIVLLMACIALERGSSIPMVSQIYIYSLVLLVIGIVCHGELNRLIPAPEHLTACYLTIAAGGAAGGVLVGIVAPMLFNRYWEYQIGLFLSAALILLALFRDPESWIHESKPWVPFAILLAVATVIGVFYGRWNILTPGQLNVIRITATVLALCTLVFAWFSFRKTAYAPWVLRLTQMLLVGFVGMLGFVMLNQILASDPDTIARQRNFYGVLRVKDRYPGRPLEFYELMHGRITHGMQLKGPEYTRTVTSYYTRKSGLGLAILNFPRKQTPDGSLRIGAVGMGVGTVSAYARPGDLVRYYEINPQVIRFAVGEQALFSYLENSAGRSEIVRGDARISLEREADENNLQQFDILVLDAFSGDAIPVHLLTREAIQLYMKHLRGPESVLAIHTSNRAVTLAPIVAGLAQDQNLNATYILQKDGTETISPSEWILLSQGVQVLNSPDVLKAGLPLIANTHAPLWTDDYSDLLSVLRH